MLNTNSEIPGWAAPWACQPATNLPGRGCCFRRRGRQFGDWRTYGLLAG
jgi:hypothetical protein